MNDGAPESETLTISGSQIKPGRLVIAELGNQRLALTRVEGVVCAFNTLCPHQLGNLARGFVHNGEIECPVHGWRFNLRTGQSVYPEEETLSLRRYTATERDGRVTVGLISPAPERSGHPNSSTI